MSDWDPELYNRFSAYRSEPVRLMLGRLLLEPGERIVDLGCGTGEHTLELARRCPDGYVVGIDSSPAMIERISAEASAAGRSRFASNEFRISDRSMERTC